MDRRWNSAWSVGRLLSLAFPYGDGGDLPPAVVAAMERGVAVHAACQEWDLGQGYTPPEPINGYLDAWKAYLRDSAERLQNSPRSLHKVLKESVRPRRATLRWRGMLHLDGMRR